MTIGELINKAISDEQIKVDAQAALSAASSALEAATTADASSDQALANALVTTGPVFVVQSDGTAFIYSSDGSGSYVVTVAKPIDTNV